MKTTKSFLAKVCGSTIGAATLLQTLTCDVQHPPDNTECIPNGGVCIARKQAAVVDLFFIGESVWAEVAGD